MRERMNGAHSDGKSYSRRATRSLKFGQIRFGVNSFITKQHVCIWADYGAQVSAAVESITKK